MYRKINSETYSELLDRIRRTDRGWLSYWIEVLCQRGEINFFPAVSDSRTVQASYVAMRLDGASHNIAEMLAFGQPPMSHSDREFLEGHCNGNQFEKTPELGDYYSRVAQRHGQDTKGKVYLSGLAAFPGDPRAWVSDRHDAEAILTERGWGSEGAVKTPITKFGKPMNVSLDPQIVEDAADDLVKTRPEAAAMKREDLEEKVADKLKPHWAD